MNTDSDLCLSETLISCLEQQISELELLQSMYPARDEIVITDKQILQDLFYFVDKKSGQPPNHLDFTINLSTNDVKLEVCVNLPSFYPVEEPDIYVRCNQLNRHQETSLNAELNSYLRENHTGEVSLYNAVLWLQDNIDRFKVIEKTKNETVEQKSKEDDKFCRLWVYCHHIYNKKKREMIVSRAKDLKLSGFCLPGKPGVICVEGIESHCKDWYQDIRSQNWKKIAIKNMETFELSEEEVQRKFIKFEELHLTNPTLKVKKSDMGEFAKFLENHGLTTAFNEFFGLFGDTTTYQ